MVAIVAHYHPLTCNGGEWYLRSFPVAAAADYLDTSAVDCPLLVVACACDRSYAGDSEEPHGGRGSSVLTRRSTLSSGSLRSTVVEDDHGPEIRIEPP